MIKRPLVIILALLVTVTAFSVRSFNMSRPAVSAPPLVIYKTKKDYSKNIPVILSDDRTKVVSYPDVKDIFQFKFEDFTLENYDPWPHIKGEVAV